MRSLSWAALGAAFLAVAPAQDPGSGSSEPLPYAVEWALDLIPRTPPERRHEPYRDLVTAARPVAAALARRMASVDEVTAPFVGAALVEIRDPQAIPALVPLLGSPRPVIRAEAVRVIGLLGTAASAPLVAPRLRDASPVVRAAALDAFALLGGPSSMREVAPLVLDPDREVRRQACQVLAYLAGRHDRGDELIEMLGSALERSRGGIMLEALLALAATRSPRIAPYLLTCLRDEDPGIRQAAVSALADLDDPRIAPAILDRVYQERETPVRLQLARAVQRLRIEAAVEPLILWLLDPDPAIVQAARRALQAITGKDFGTDTVRWDAWRRGEKPR